LQEVVSYLARPVAMPTWPRRSGNLTGVTTLNVEVVPKRLGVLHELVPAATVKAVLINPMNDPAAVEDWSRLVQAAAHALGLQIDVLHASTERDVDSAFSILIQRRAGGLSTEPHAFFSIQRTARRTGIAPRDANGFSVSRVRHSRPADELRREHS
jgi:putative ABC transport system substrate-binding protein